MTIVKGTRVLIAVQCLFYLAMLTVGGAGELRELSAATLIRGGALYAPLVREGQWWRLVTMIFIHLSPLHLLLNMAALYELGALLEARLGWRRFLALYLVAGLGGSLSSLAWHLHSQSAAAGASGAICGLIGAAAVTGQRIGGSPGKRLRDTMAGWMLIVLGFGLLVNVDNAAHLGGLVAGTLFAWWLGEKAPAVSAARTGT